MPQSARPLLVLTALAALLAACTVEDSRDTGTGGSDAPGADVSSRPGAIRIEPAHAEYTVVGAPVVIDYRAYQRQADGSETEVTATATWSSTAALGSFVGAQFTSRTNRGGLTNIRARWAPRWGPPPCGFSTTRCS